LSTSIIGQCLSDYFINIHNQVLIGRIAMQKDSMKEPPIPSNPPRSAVIIVNPASGSFPRHTHRLDETLAFLRRQDWRVDLQITKEPGDAQRFAREAVAKKIDVVISVGGDGTINEIIQELAGTETALGVLPCGTVNIWARETGIPLDDAGARGVLVHGQTRHIDLGYVNGRYFLLMAGIGFDGEVVHAVERKPIKRLGVIGYLLAGTWLIPGYPSFHAQLDIDGRKVRTRALQIIIGNTQLYGGAIKYTWQAKCDDGLLDVCIVRQRSMVGRIVVFMDFLLRRDQRRQWVRYYTCTSVKIRTRQPIAIQVDGDIAGHTPKGYKYLAFNVVPGALKVVVPQKLSEELFSNS